LEEIKGTYITKTESKDYDDDLKKIIYDFIRKFEEFESKTDKRDAKYIAYTVSQFADDLKNNAIRSQKGYQALLDFYDYYKNVLGKNSYVDDEIKFIKEKMGELKSKN
jgi:intein/homing endonuclease